MHLAGSGSQPLPIRVFCGSSPGSRPEYRSAAEESGAELVRRNIGLVYGRGNVGLMGVLADAVLKAGGVRHLLGRLCLAW